MTFLKSEADKRVATNKLDKVVCPSCHKDLTKIYKTGGNPVVRTNKEVFVCENRECWKFIRINKLKNWIK